MHSSSDEDQLAARGQVIGIYGRGSVEQDQPSLKDGWQANRILRKSESGSGFEAIVIKMAWLAKADLDLKLLRIFRAEQRRALPQSAHKAVDAVARPGCRCRAVKAYLTPSPVSHERPNMYVASNFTELCSITYILMIGPDQSWIHTAEGGRDLMLRYSLIGHFFASAWSLNVLGYHQQGSFRHGTCGTKCLECLCSPGDLVLRSYFLLNLYRCFFVMHDFSDDEIETIKAHTIHNGPGAIRDFFESRCRERENANFPRSID